MKKTTENICKFVSAAPNPQLTVENFVYEKNAPAKGELRIPRTHALHLIVGGSGQLVTEHAVRTLLPGMLVFSFAGVPYCMENGGAMEYMYISFGGERAAVLFDRFSVSRANCIFTGFSGLIPFWQDCLAKANDENLELICEGLLLYTFSQLSTAGENSEMRLVGELLQYIEHHFADSELSMTALAEGFGYHPKYLSHLFVQTMNTTFTEYLKNLRLRHAVFLMEQGITAVKNVAFLCGYRDPLYFSKVFRQTIGVSPREFIREHEAE